MTIFSTRNAKNKTRRVTHYTNRLTLRGVSDTVRLQLACLPGKRGMTKWVAGADSISAGGRRP